MIDIGLYFEHDWTADGRCSAKRKSRLESAESKRKLSGYVDKLQEDAKVELGRQISRTR